MEFKKILSAIIIILTAVLIILFFYSSNKTIDDNLKERTNSCKELCISGNNNYVKISYGGIHTRDLCYCKKLNGEIFTIEL